MLGGEALSFFSFQIKILLICLFIVTSVAAPRQVTRGGLSFLREGNFLISGTKWTITFDVHLRSYLDRIDSVMTSQHSLMGAFTPPEKEPGEDQAPLTSTLSYLRQESHLLYDLLVQLKMEVLHAFDGIIAVPNRPRRGLVDAGGDVLKFLFGTADADDIRELNAKIESMKTGVTSVLHLVKEQATYLNHTLTIVLANRAAIGKIALANNMLSKNFHHIYVIQILGMIARSLEVAYLELYGEWTKFREAIVLLAQGKINSYFIAADVLYETLRTIRDEMPANMEFLAPLTMDIMPFYYSWIVAIPTVQNHTLRVFLEVPLKTKHSYFELYRVLITPEYTQDTNVAFYIEPDSPYLAVTSDRELHLLIREEDLLECVGTTTKLCNVLSMVRKQSCLLKVFQGTENEISGLCSKKVIQNPNPVFYRVSDKGTWVYSTPRPLILNSICAVATQNEVLHLKGGTGTLNVPQGCVAYGPNIVLPSHFQGKAITVDTKIPRLMTLDGGVPFSEWERRLLEQYVSFKENLTLTDRSPNNDLHLDLDDLDKEINHIQSTLSASDDSSFKSTYWWWTSTTTALSVFAAATVLLYCLVNYCRQRRKEASRRELFAKCGYPTLHSIISSANPEVISPPQLTGTTNKALEPQTRTSGTPRENWFRRFSDRFRGGTYALPPGNTSPTGIELPTLHPGDCGTGLKRSRPVSKLYVSSTNLSADPTELNPVDQPTTGNRQPTPRPRSSTVSQPSSSQETLVAEIHRTLPRQSPLVDQRRTRFPPISPISEGYLDPISF